MIHNVGITKHPFSWDGDEDSGFNIAVQCNEDERAYQEPISDYDGREPVLFQGRIDPEDLQWIVDCMNACNGMENPIQEVSDLNKLPKDKNGKIFIPNRDTIKYKDQRVLSIRYDVGGINGWMCFIGEASWVKPESCGLVK